MPETVTFVFLTPHIKSVAYLLRIAAASSSISRKLQKKSDLRGRDQKDHK
jgi:hypothetical protein